MSRKFFAFGVALLSLFVVSLSSLARAADVRNSNWGDTPEVVKQNQKEITEQNSPHPRTKKLVGTTLVGEKTYNVEYAFLTISS